MKELLRYVTVNITVIAMEVIIIPIMMIVLITQGNPDDNMITIITIN